MLNEKYKLHELIETVYKGGIAFLASCYVLGFIIINVHLAHFGILDIELIKSRYIASGLLFMFYVFVTVGGSYHYVSRWPWHKLRLIFTQDGKKERLAFILQSFITFTLIFYILPCNLIGYDLFDRYTIGSYFVTTCFIAFAYIGVHHTISVSPRGWELDYYLILGIVLILLGTTTLFANLLYPLMHAHYGGGRLLQAQITFNNESTSASLCRILNGMPLEINLVSQNAEITTLYLVLHGKGESYDATVSLPRTEAHLVAFLGESRVYKLSGHNKDIFQIARIFAEVSGYTETCKQIEILKNKLQQININDKELDFFVNLFQKITKEIQDS